MYLHTYSFGFGAQLRTAVTHALTHGIPIILALLHPLTHSTLVTTVLGKGIPAVWFGYRTTPFEIYTYHIAPSPSLSSLSSLPHSNLTADRPNLFYFLLSSLPFRFSSTVLISSLAFLSPLFLHSIYPEKPRSAVRFVIRNVCEI